MLADELEKIVFLHDASNIAAVIVEPIAGSTGVLMPQRLPQAAAEICTKHGILLIFDEVITGFGRLGAPFAAQEFDVIPDMITCAKGLTNGAIPMGAVLVSNAIYDDMMAAGKGPSSCSTATPTPVIRWPPPRAWRPSKSIATRTC